MFPNAGLSVAPRKQDVSLPLTRSLNRRSSTSFSNALAETFYDQLADLISKRLNENAGLQFAQAAGGAYQNAGDTLESRNRFRTDLEYRQAMDKANLNRSSLYDARRPGGLFQDLMKAGMQAASGGLSSALGSTNPSRSLGLSSSYPMGDGNAPGTWV